MKKSIIFVLITMTLVFASYVGGFYVGRNHSLGSIQILGLLPESTLPITTVPHTTQPVIIAAPPTSHFATAPTDPIASTFPTDPTGTFPTEPAIGTSPTEPVSGTSPTEPVIVAPTVPETTRPTEQGLININTASLELLDTLPGIGPKLAQAIIDYRTEYGNFETPEDILNVPGIGEKKLAAIIDLITTGG